MKISIYKSIQKFATPRLCEFNEIFTSNNGNSSSGIIEAPFFHLPAVNIGTARQRVEIWALMY